MRIYNVLNSNVTNIAIRVGDGKDYKKSSLKYFGLLDDIPPKYCSFEVNYILIVLKIQF